MKPVKNIILAVTRIINVEIMFVHVPMQNEWRVLQRNHENSPWEIVENCRMMSTAAQVYASLVHNMVLDIQFVDAVDAANAAA